MSPDSIVFWIVHVSTKGDFVKCFGKVQLNENNDNKHCLLDTPHSNGHLRKTFEDTERAAVVYSLFIIAPIVCGCFVPCPCCVVPYFEPRQVLQSSHWGRGSWLLYLSCLLGVFVSCDCYRFLPLSHRAVGLSAVCDCGISCLRCGIFWSYSLFMQMLNVSTSFV